MKLHPYADVRSAAGVSTVLAGLGLALCWLTPNHFLPWLSFDGDLGTTAVMLLVAWGVWITTSAQWVVPRMMLGILVFAALPLLQFGTGLVYYAGDAWICFGALFGLALTLPAGAVLQGKGISVADMVLSAALCASIFSVGIELWQWLRLAELDDFAGLGLWLMRLPAGMRPFANLAQPNQLSTLLLWGLAGVWWLFMRRSIGAATALFAAAYLLTGVAMTQSRSGWIGLLSMAVIARIHAPRPEVARHAFALMAMLLYFFCLVAAWSSINEALFLSASESLEQRLSAGARLLNWKICLAALWSRPWFGFGWGQVAVAQQEALLSGQASGEYFAYAHNLVLDLLLWSGIPLGMAAVVAFGAWLTGLLRRIASAEGAALTMAVVALLVHAMLEYPHAYFYFLLPVGLMLGAVAAIAPGTKTVAVPHAFIGLLLAVATVLTAWIAHDYFKAAENMQTLRFEAARIGTSRHSEAPDIALLTQLKEYLATSRIDVNQPLDAATLERLRKSARRYASDSSLFRYAMAAAVSGRPDAAADALQRLCRIQVLDRCEKVRAAWQQQAQAHPEMLVTLTRVQQ